MSTTTFPAGLSEAKKQFVTNFYATSDRPEAVDEVSAWLGLDSERSSAD